MGEEDSSKLWQYTKEARMQSKQSKSIYAELYGRVFNSRDGGRVSYLFFHLAYPKTFITGGIFTTWKKVPTKVRLLLSRGDWEMK